MASSGRRARAGYWFVAPATLVLLLVLVVPVVHVLYESFVWTTSSRIRVVPSARNYAALLEDEVVRIAATNTITFTVASVLGHLVIGLAVALLLNQQIRGRAGTSQPADAALDAIGRSTRHRIVSARLTILDARPPVGSRRLSPFRRRRRAVDLPSGPSNGFMYDRCCYRCAKVPFVRRRMALCGRGV